MNKRATPLNLHVIIIKIVSHTGLFVGSDRKDDYDKLIEHLKKLQIILKPYVWLDMNSVSDMDYERFVPPMAYMIQWIDDFKIERTLHYWHYQERNTKDKLDEITVLVSDFLTFLKKELDLEND